MELAREGVVEREKEREAKCAEKLFVCAIVERERSRRSMHR